MFRYNRAYGLECFIFLDTEISSTKIPPETWSDRLTSEIEPCNLKLTTNLHSFCCCERSVPLILLCHLSALFSTPEETKQLGHKETKPTKPAKLLSNQTTITYHLQCSRILVRRNARSG